MMRGTQDLLQHVIVRVTWSPLTARALFTATAPAHGYACTQTLTNTEPTRTKVSLALSANVHTQMLTAASSCTGGRVHMISCTKECGDMRMRVGTEAEGPGGSAAVEGKCNKVLHNLDPVHFQRACSRAEQTEDFTYPMIQRRHDCT